MIPVTEFAGHELAVYGLGETGLSAALALKAGGAVPIVWDADPERVEMARRQGLVAVDLLEVDWTRFLAIVMSPGIPLDHPVAEKARALNIPIIGDMELFARAIGPKDRREARVIAVTGTNGKSVTTALIGHILQRNGFDARVGGNIVAPVLALDPPGQDTIYVLEISSFQLDLTYTLAPDVAVLTNLSPDHLDRHGSMEAYAAVKMRIFEGQGQGDMAVVGIDDDYAIAVFDHLVQRSAETGTATVPVSMSRQLETGLFAHDGYLFDADAQPGEPVADLTRMATLPGRHNWQNAAAAVAAVRRFLPDTDKIIAGLQSFPGIANRMEIVATVGGVWFINDSKCTNAAAAARALECYESVYWIAGGRAKDDDLNPIAPYLSRVRKAYLIGESGEDFARALEGHVETSVMGTLDRAVATAFTDAAREGHQGAVVLFSPACTSYDQYANFEERGEAFRRVVRALETVHRRARDGGPGA